LSVNVEIPKEENLKLLAPEKDHKSVFAPMKYIQQGVLESKEERQKFRHAPRFAPAGQSTQVIVGATSESDKDILFLSSALYGRPTMKRVYYSGYVSVNTYDKRLPALKQPPLVRENRLYQADWLLRFYQFKVDEIVDDAYPDLDLEIDPKLSWLCAIRTVSCRHQQSGLRNVAPCAGSGSEVGEVDCRLPPFFATGFL
jgi:predicted DNA-binding helix-hairpin-helix protein